MYQFLIIAYLFTLLSTSEDGDSSVESEHDPTIVSRFEKYSNPVQTEGKENGPLTHDMLKEMFGDAQTDSSDSKSGLCLDKAQIGIIKLSWRCQAPDKLSAYKESSK